MDYNEKVVQYYAKPLEAIHASPNFAHNTPSKKDKIDSIHEDIKSYLNDYDQEKQSFDNL